MSDTLNLDAYLGRIGYAGAVAADRATLAALHAAHVDAIPFEGLDPFLRRPVKLDLGALQRKLVAGRRGGYCYQQNTLFKAVLEAIGFKVTGLGARVRWMAPPGSPLGPRTHMLLKVDLPDGAVLADVGFGACMLDAPLALETGREQATAMATFRLVEENGLHTLSAKQPGGWRTAYVFTLEPQLAADNELGNWFTSTSPDVPFTGAVVLERVAAGRRHKLVNARYLVETRDGALASEERLADAAAFEAVLSDVFGVVPPVPAAEIFARLPAS